jgi:para-nitrobenzyl esterase
MKRAAVGYLVLIAQVVACSDDAGSGGAGGEGGEGGSGGAAAGPLLIETDKGPVEGALIDGVRTFLGIPFAAPPTGDLRWRAPVPAEPWTETRSAIARGPSCAQNATLSNDYNANSSEDCLTTNVWTPDDAANGSRPVLVWIHGGGFTLGSGGEPAYDGKVLAQTTGAVVVTLNYRLGVFGFLAHPDLAAEDSEHPSSGAYGIEDQRAALVWVQDNIAAFGGDPTRVTVFGESAGGISACFHVVSPLSAGLFTSAILESGPCDQGTPLVEAEAQGAELAAAVGCDAVPDVPACLRAKPPAELSTALAGGSFLFGDGANWFPAIDGYNLPEEPTRMIAQGDFNNVPIILGSNADEATLFFALAGSEYEIQDEADFEALAETLMPTHGAEVVARYPIADYGSAQAAAEAAVGDAGFICNARRTARAFTAKGGKAYLYHFTHAPENALIPELGAFHSAEIRYVFGVPGQLLTQPLSAEELGLSKEMMGYWFGLSEKGDPNGGERVPWPAYDVESDQHLTLSMSIASGAKLKQQQCDFWDELDSAGN